MKIKAMKKIKNNSQLQEKKQQLRRREKELEKAIIYDWKDLKESVKPKNIAEQLLSGEHYSEKRNSSKITESVSDIASLWTKKLIGHAEAKFKKWFKK
jgi:hypothetical protein